MTAQTVKHNGLKDNIKEIYKKHNGLVLEEHLKAITLDDSFEFMATSSDKYEFENSNGQSIILSSDGELCNHANIDPDFLNISKWRIKRTNEMLNMLYN